MSKRKLWIWVLGVVIAAGVVAFVRSQAGGDDLAVQLVDGETGKPVTNAGLHILTEVRIPVLCHIQFLPPKMRLRNVERYLESTNGEFRVQRISASDKRRARVRFTFNADGFSSGFFYYDGIVLSPPVWGPPGTDIRVPSQGSVVIPLKRESKQ